MPFPRRARLRRRRRFLGNADPAYGRPAGAWPRDAGAGMPPSDGSAFGAEPLPGPGPAGRPGGPGRRPVAGLRALVAGRHGHHRPEPLDDACPGPVRQARRGGGVEADLGPGVRGVDVLAARAAGRREPPGQLGAGPGHRAHERCRHRPRRRLRLAAALRRRLAGGAGSTGDPRRAVRSRLGRAQSSGPWLLEWQMLTGSPGRARTGAAREDPVHLP